MFLQRLFLFNSNSPISVISLDFRLKRMNFTKPKRRDNTIRNLLTI